MLPTRGIDKNRIEMDHKVILKAPEDWHTATQLKGVEGEWVAEGRDEFLDAIMESNANPMITFEVRELDSTSSCGILVDYQFQKRDSTDS